MADEEFDVIVVGSGANGGWAAKRLCEAGMKVLMLEAGRKLDPETDFGEHKQPYELKTRGRGSLPEQKERRPIGSRNYAFGETNSEFYIDEVDNPYTYPKKKPFWWIRANMVGGRSILWARQSYRFSAQDLKPASHDGYGEDWPLTYEELAPYYEIVERHIGVSGQREGYTQLPDSYFLPPMKLSCGEQRMKKAINGMGRPFTIGRVAILTRNHKGRAACHYCGPCHKGCSTNSYFNSPTSTLPDAEATGNFSLYTNCIVHKVETNDRNKAKSVIYYDKLTGTPHEAKGKMIVLAASTLESTRILMNSANKDYENGLGNSSGVLGHYLMDHMYALRASGTYEDLGRIPELANRPNGIYVPRFQNLPGGKQEKDYIRGYGFQGGENITSYEHAYAMKGFGKKFKDDIEGENIARVSLSGFGEMLPRFENRAFLDPDVKDKWGIPAMHMDTEHSDNEKAMAKDIVVRASEMLEAAGATGITTTNVPAPIGFGIHECGTARMGNDPKKSVLNKFNQSHDIKNLFVMDGAAFVSIACQNPTLTMMALTVRACDNLIAEAKKGNVA